MFNALVVLWAVVISEASSFDPAGFYVVPTQATNPFHAPAEPPTLVLAAIGIGIIGAYAATQRLWRSQRPAAKVPRSTTSSQREVTERQKRGAA